MRSSASAGSSAKRVDCAHQEREQDASQDAREDRFAEDGREANPDGHADRHAYREPLQDGWPGRTLGAFFAAELKRLADLSVEVRIFRHDGPING